MAGVAIAFLALRIVAHLVHVVPGALSIGFAALGAVAVLVIPRYDARVSSGPTTLLVGLADLAVWGALLTAALTVPTGPAALVGAPLAYLGIGAVAAFAARTLRMHALSGSGVAFALDAWGAASDNRRTAAVLTAAGGALVGTLLALTHALPIGNAIPGALIAMMPALRGVGPARRRSRTRQAVSAALSGLWTVAGNGTTPWSRYQVDRHTSPARVTAWDRETPTKIEFPLPPERVDGDQDAKAQDINRRLGELRWGSWAVAWDNARHRAVLTPRTIPTMAAYPGSRDLPWSSIPLGVGDDGEVIWDLTILPHALVAGPTGSGKSVVQRMMLFHAIQRPDEWQVVGVDPKRVELAAYEQYENVLKIARDLEDGVDAIQRVRDEMMRRFEEMEAAGVNHADRLPAPPRALMLMIDETFNLLAPEGVKTEEGKERDALHGRASALLGEIARLGRAAKVHAVLATQRPDSKVLSGELKNNLDCRIAAGRMDSTPSLMVLDAADAADLPKVKGRGLIRRGGELSEFQGYFAEPTWIDEWLAGAHRTAPASPTPSVAARGSRRVAGPTSGITTLSRGETPSPDLGDLDALVPALTFDNVGGYEAVKAELEQTVGMALRESDAAAAYGVETGGVLLYGPPGTGKTYLAEALAGTLGVRFLKVSVGDLTGPYVGDKAAKVRAAVDAAILAAPSILLIDEIDAVAGRRDDETSGEGRAGVNEILVQLDRARQTPGVVVMATTNELSRLDPAVIRDGRMSARIRIDLPDVDARASILTASLAGRPAGSIDVSLVAQRTPGFTAATLNAVVDAAARNAMAEGRRPIATDDLVEAIKARGGQDRPTVEGAGLDSLVLTADTEQHLRQVLALMSDPDRARAYGIEPPTGLLLEGPPGTGKTSIARALAAEARTSFYPISPGEWTSKWQGESERQVREVFERARTNAPSIVFIDEIDSIGGARGENDSNGSSRILTSLLAEMDGFASAAAGHSLVFVIGATNRAEVLDPALTRPGRLSRSVHIGLPDGDARAALLDRLTAQMPLAEDVDLAHLASATAGLSPAEMKGLCEVAALEAFGAGQAGSEPLVSASAFERALNSLGRPQQRNTEGLDWLSAVDDGAVRV
ncbi:AAA family ATPase [Oryzihumus leptocrescens]|uniref:AAA family ATPase n=1 Tax=Oryzihumus leptocrescens TaxID=297536 RepID=UPI00115064CE|nr:AAA family ATPase [Oryzihumus leptocrescens]